MNKRPSSSRRIPPILVLFAIIGSSLSALFLPSPAYAATALADQILATQAANLQAYWKADETSGTTLADSSGNGNDLTLSGGFTLGVEGQVGNAVSFDGVDGVASRTSSVLGSTTPAFTVLMLLKAPSGQQSSGTSYHFSIGNSTDGNQVIGGFLSADADDGVRCFLKSGPELLNTGSGPMFMDEWRFGAFRFDGVDTFEIWINDWLAITETNAITLPSGFDRTGLGALVRDTTSSFVESTIQHAAVWDTALSDAEIKAIFAETGLQSLNHDVTISIVDRGVGNPIGTHAQGAAFDGTHHYLSVSDSIFKYTRDDENNYTLVTSRDTTADWPAGMTQQNGMHFFNGSLWVGGNNFSNTPKKGWIMEFDPSDLSHIATHEVDAHWSEGGAWHDVGDGDQFWAVFTDWDRISRWEFQGGNWTKVDDFTAWLVETYETTLGSGGFHAYQGAQWMTQDVLVAQTHNNNETPGHVRDTETHFYQWTGTRLEPFAVHGALPPDPTGNSGVGQGIHWEKTTEAVSGDTMLFAERGADDDGEPLSTQQNIVRATVDVPDLVAASTGGGGTSISIRSIIVEDITPTSATVKWNTSPATNNTRLVGEPAPADSEDTQTTTSHEAVLTNLTPDTLYSYRIEAGFPNRSVEATASLRLKTSVLEQDDTSAPETPTDTDEIQESDQLEALRQQVRELQLKVIELSSQLVRLLQQQISAAQAI